VIAVDTLDALSQAQLRQTVELLLMELRHKAALVDKLTHEMAVLKRLKFASTSEKFCAGMKAEQTSP
jgi:transposase